MKRGVPVRKMMCFHKSKGLLLRALCWIGSPERWCKKEEWEGGGQIVIKNEDIVLEYKGFGE
jgi:hypothetical protein